MNETQAYIVPEGVKSAFANGGLSTIGRNKIYELINEGRLKARKLDKRTVVLHEDLMDFLHNLPPYLDSKV